MDKDEVVISSANGVKTKLDKFMKNEVNCKFAQASKALNCAQTGIRTSDNYGKYDYAHCAVDFWNKIIFTYVLKSFESMNNNYLYPSYFHKK